MWMRNWLAARAMGAGNGHGRGRGLRVDAPKVQEPRTSACTFPHRDGEREGGRDEPWRERDKERTASRKRGGGNGIGAAAGAGVRIDSYKRNRWMRGEKARPVRMDTTNTLYIYYISSLNGDWIRRHGWTKAGGQTEAGRHETAALQGSRYAKT